MCSGGCGTPSCWNSSEDIRALEKYAATTKVVTVV